MWCLAWRLLVKHGADTLPFMDAQIVAALRDTDEQSLSYWTRMREAAEQLAK